MEDLLWTCVYDTSHQIRLGKLNLHLAKCRAKYVKERKKKGLPVEIGICSFSSLHHIHLAEMMVHEDNCKEKPTIPFKTSLKWGLGEKAKDEDSDERDVCVYLSPVKDVGPDAPPVQLSLEDKRSRIRWYEPNPVDVDHEEWRSLDLSGKVPATKTHFTTQIETMKQYYKRKANEQLAMTSVSLAVGTDDLPGPSRQGAAQKLEVIQQTCQTHSSSVMKNISSKAGTNPTIGSTAQILDLTSSIPNSPLVETKSPDKIDTQENSTMEHDVLPNTQEVDDSVDDVSESDSQSSSSDAISISYTNVWNSEPQSSKTKSDFVGWTDDE